MTLASKCGLSVTQAMQAQECQILLGRRAARDAAARELNQKHYEIENKYTPYARILQGIGYLNHRQVCMARFGGKILKDSELVYQST